MHSFHTELTRVEGVAGLSRFRREFYDCLTARGDALFELVEALLCADGPVKTLVGLALAPEHRRGHGALYDGLNCGRVDVGRLRQALAELPLPRAAGGRIVLAVDVSPWLRPDAPTSAERGVLPRLWPREEPVAAHPGLAVLLCRGAGDRPHLVDRGAGRGPPRPHR